MKKFVKLLGSLLTLVALFVACDKGQKNEPIEAYPSKPVNVIVAYKAGGGTDVGARILISEAQKNFQQPFVIVNKPGADGEIGYTELLKSKPDGYTIGFINLPTFVSIPLQRKTNFKKEDATAIMNHVYDPGVLVVKNDSKWKNLQEFVEDARNNPDTLTISNNGTGASNHIGAAHFAYEAGIKVTHVPFGGSTDMIAALRGNHVDATVAKISEVGNLVKNNELRILASFTENKLENFPDVPTLKENGYNVLFGSARAIVAPTGTPQEVIQKLHDTFKEALESQDNIEKSKNANLPLQYMSPEELTNYINEQETYIKEIVPKLGI
ncbi:MULTISPECIES: tripartite tricarboxylate transporter substrate binding protein [Fusobacterium]|jgi:tripartite-type tricarboxylate transporter receptor subunit TctC|uniref:Tripartite tricarboxylate transporter substrate binding protein n=1 Tax=Fusobacterium hominis TaxID=2764326 RepID=A0A7G9GUA4_9FUSO|nr:MULTISPECIES: tripartite tricarboxylate transporter substrate binding protein [Fusobacterium]QNM14386.1 tripartite tricarboxylate transporter substrate binding protein [Fusobacterium hominis]